MAHSAAELLDTRGWENLSITLGVNDLPGFAYWATRWSIESLAGEP